MLSHTCSMVKGRGRHLESPVAALVLQEKEAGGPWPPRKGDQGLSWAHGAESWSLLGETNWPHALLCKKNQSHHRECSFFIHLFALHLASLSEGRPLFLDPMKYGFQTCSDSCCG